MSTLSRKKPQSQLDIVLSENPLLKKEMERRLKAARVQAASLAEQSKEQLRYKLVELELRLEEAARREQALHNKLKLKSEAVVKGDGNLELGELRIANAKLEAEKENLQLALKDLQKGYAKAVNDLTAYRARKG